MNHSRHPQKSVIHAVASVRWHSRLLAKPKSFTLTDQMTQVLLGAAKRSTTIVRPALRIKAFLSRKAQITAALNWRLNPASPQIAGTGWMRLPNTIVFLWERRAFPALRRKHIFCTRPSLPSERHPLCFIPMPRFERRESSPFGRRHVWEMRNHDWRSAWRSAKTRLSWWDDRPMRGRAP